MCGCRKSSTAVARPDEVVAASTPANADEQRREQETKSQAAALSNARS